MKTARREFTITKFKADPKLAYTARVTHTSGAKITANYKYGSWQAETKTGTKEVLPHIAAVLSSRLPKGVR